MPDPRIIGMVTYPLGEILLVALVGTYPKNIRQQLDTRTSAYALNWTAVFPSSPYTIQKYKQDQDLAIIVVYGSQLPNHHILMDREGKSWRISNLFWVALPLLRERKP